MGNTDFINADPWGIPVEDVATEPPDDEAPEAAPADEAEEVVVEQAAASPAVTIGDEPDQEPALMSESALISESAFESVVVEAEPDEAIREAPQAAIEDTTEEPVQGDSAVSWEPEQEETTKAGPVAWESDTPRPESKARGFSQMLAAALSSIRPREEADQETAEPANPVGAVSDTDVLDETPAWMIEADWPSEEAAAAKTVSEDTEPAEEVAVAGPEGAEEAVAEEEEAELEKLVAALVVEELDDEDEPAPIELPASSPEVFRELEQLPDEETAAAVALGLAAARESAGRDQEPTPAPEGVVEAVAAEVTTAEAEAVETEEGQGGQSSAEAPQIVAASPGVEWGSRWRETAQGWVEDADGHSTWRPIVVTSSSLAQWDVDTFLGVVAGDAVGEWSDNLPSVIAAARGDALQQMLDDAVSRGAHAVIGASFSVHERGSAVIVTATGTAVTLQARD